MVINLIDKIFSDSAIIASTITSIVALIGIIVGAINYIYQNSQKNKTDYHKMIKDKLEYFYAPLYLKYSVDPNYMITYDEDMMSKIINYSYLIDINTRKLLIIIIEIESKIEHIDESDNYKSQIDKLKKYKETLVKYLAREYAILSSCYEKVFQDIDLKYRKNSNKSTINIIKKIFKMLTIVFISLFLIILTYKHFLQFGYLLIFQEFILPVILFIFSYGTAFYIADFASFIWDYIRKALHQYIPGESVPVEGEYKCIYCNKKEFFYNDTIFMPCANENKHKILFKNFSRWKKA